MGNCCFDFGVDHPLRPAPVVHINGNLASGAVQIGHAFLGIGSHVGREGYVVEITQRSRAGQGMVMAMRLPVR